MRFPSPFRLLLVTKQGYEDEDELIRLLIKERVRALRDEDVTVAWNAQEARQLTASRFDLTVVHADLAANRRGGFTPGVYLGLDVLKEAVERGDEARFILVAPLLDRTIVEETAGLDRCRAVQQDVDFDGAFLQAIDELFPAAPRRAPPPPPVSRADVEIRLLSVRPSYRISVRAPGRTYTVSDALYLGNDMQTTLGRLHENVRVGCFPVWKDALETIGGRLFGQLRATRSFERNFLQARETVGGVQNMRFRFVVEDGALYPLAWESLHMPLEPPPPPQAEDVPMTQLFWMLQAPLLRNLQPNSGNYPTFTNWHDRGLPINTLIIETNVSGYLDGVGHFSPLSNVPCERAALQKLVAEHIENAAHPVFTPPVVIAPDTVPPHRTFREHLRETLEGGTVWHIVHFGGHTYFDEHARRGYAILPDGPAPDGLDLVSLDELGLWLRNACVLYLSNCRQSEDNVVLALARRQIPAVVGFRWKLDDTMADEHAQAFYEELIINSGQIEEAFLQARQKLHDAHMKDRIWASPMLMLQGGNRMERLLEQALRQRLARTRAAE